MTCWKCKANHKPRFCPQLRNKCYFCGESTHLVNDCLKKPSATCFICKQVGHLSTTCLKRQSEISKPPSLGTTSVVRKNGNMGNRPAGRVYNLEGTWYYESDEDESECAALYSDEAGLIAGTYCYYNYNLLQKIS